MYPSSSSSSSQGSMGPSGLIRYDSAPGSFLSNAVDSVGSQPHHHRPTPPRFFSSHSDNNSSDQDPVQRPSPYYLNDMSVGAGAVAGDFVTNRTSPLVRHSSSPAGFLNQIAASVSTAPSSNNNGGFPVTRGLIGTNFNTKSSININQDINGSGSGSTSSSNIGNGITRLNSQLSFTRQEALPHISEEEHDDDDETGLMEDNEIRIRKPAGADNSYGTTSNFGVGSSSSCWEQDSNTIVFSQPNNKRSKNTMSTSDRVNSMESQLQFGVTQGGMEMVGMEKLLNMNIPQDSVPCKIRASRGCATHPRSIAERERRMRISGKLKKLQELVPNMDKQTSYSDMLDLAVQHIKGLQTHVQKLQHDMEKCTCGCKGAS